MSNLVWFYIGFLLLFSFFALGMLFLGTDRLKEKLSTGTKYKFFKKNINQFFLALVIFIITFACYWQLGEFDKVRARLILKEDISQKGLQVTIEDKIKVLEQQVANNPSYNNKFSLSQLYYLLNKQEQAFRLVDELLKEKENINLLYQWIELKLTLNKSQFNTEILQKIMQTLKLNPEDFIGQNYLALNHFFHKEYYQALVIWQGLLAQPVGYENLNEIKLFVEDSIFNIKQNSNHQYEGFLVWLEYPATFTYQNIDNKFAFVSVHELDEQQQMIPQPVLALKLSALIIPTNIWLDHNWKIRDFDPNKEYRIKVKIATNAFDKGYMNAISVILKPSTNWKQSINLMLQ